VESRCLSSRWCRSLTVTTLIGLSASSGAFAESWSTDCPKDRLEFRLVDVGAVTLHVGCQGKTRDNKPTLIFLHGFPESWEGWHEVASILARKFRLVLPDQRGFNLSDKPVDPFAYRLENLVGDVAGLIEAVSPNRPVILVGHDLGGLIAYAAASQLPQGMIAGLVIANAPHPNVYQQLFLADLAKLPILSGQVAASQYIPTFFPSSQCPLPGLCPYAIPEVQYSNPDEDADTDDPDAVDYDHLIRLVDSWGGDSLIDQDLFDGWNQTPGPTPDTHLTTMLNWYRAIVPLLFGPLPAFNVDVPTLVVWGRTDRALIEANVDLTSHPDYPGVQTVDEFVPNLRVTKFTDAGHFIQHEKPIEVAAVIKKFVDSLSSEAGPGE